MSCDCDELGADDDPEPPRPPVVAECDDPDWKPSKGMSREECRRLAALAYCASRPWDPWCKWYGRKRKKEKAERTKAALALAALVWLLWRD